MKTGHAYALTLGLRLLGEGGVLWFVPGAGELMVRRLNVNRTVAVVNGVVGIVSLFMASSLPASRP